MDKVEKECFKCHLVLPLGDFYKHSGMADGRVNKCKACNKRDVSKNYRNNIGHYKEYEKSRRNLPHRVEARDAYAKTDNGIAAAKKARLTWEASNQIKKGAAVLVNNAVRDGRLEKPSDCSNCGNSPKSLHGHHDDYAYPLVVRWLCAGCHSKWHKENGAGING